MASIKVVVQGAAGRMGREVVAAICRESDMEPVGAVDLRPGITYDLPDGSGSIPLSSSLEETDPLNSSVVVDRDSRSSPMWVERVSPNSSILEDTMSCNSCTFTATEPLSSPIHETPGGSGWLNRETEAARSLKVEETDSLARLMVEAKVSSNCLIPGTANPLL